MDASAEVGAVYHPDRLRSDTLEFWLRTFVCHMEALTSPVANAALGLYQRLVRFVVKLLEQNDNFDVLVGTSSRCGRGWRL